MRRLILSGLNVLLPVFLLLICTARQVTAQVIYVGPGLEIDNIKYGIAQAEDGDTIIVKDGTYLQDISVYKSVVLKAENQHKAIIGDGSGTSALIRIKREKTNNVVIEGFKFAAANTNGIVVGGTTVDQSPTGCTIRNNLIEGRKDGIVVFKTAESTVLEGNVIRNCKGAGIRQHGYGNNLIVGDTIENCQGPGIFMMMDNDPVEEGPVTLRNNVIRNNNMTGVVIEMPHITLEGNLIEGNGEGISTNSYRPGIVIRDSNRIVGNEELGIKIETGTEAKILNNIIGGNGMDGIHTRGNVVITGNWIEENGECGIRIPSGDAYMDDNDLIGNAIYGLEFEGGPERVRVYNSRISGNLAGGINAGMGALLQGNTFSENMGQGIWVNEACKDLQILNDTFINNFGDELFAAKNSSMLVRYCLFEEDSTRMEDRSGLSGIVVEGSAQIERNTIRNIIDIGIHIADLSDSANTIRLNQIEKCGRGLHIMGPAQVQENKIEQCWNQGIGIELPAHDVTLFKNEITENWRGIKYFRDVPRIAITRNKIHRNAYGIIASGQAVLRSNTITNNDTSGIVIQFTGNDLGTQAEGDSGLNVIANNGKWNIFSRITEDVSAYYNWWGLTTADSIDATIRDDEEEPEAGKVLFEPFLGKNVVGIESPGKWGGARLGVSELEVFPNPFREQLKIKYLLHEPGQIQVRIIDVTGRIIRTISTAGNKPPGIYHLIWDGCNNSGQPVPGGCYFIVLDGSSIAFAVKQ